MILSDRSIREAIASGRLGIDPFEPSLVQPSSIDLRLDHRFLVFRNTKRAFIDVKEPADELMELIEVGPEEPMFLHPHEFVLGSTVERVRIPNDLVARLEGRSSLGRLGVVIHSSLPYDAPVLFLDDERGVLECRPIGELVEKRVRGRVVGFDPESFQVGFHEVTNWFRELPDKIYEVQLVSGRRVNVTAGHNLFTLDDDGNLTRTATRALRRGTRVAIPKRIPDPTAQRPELRVLDLLPAELRSRAVCQGPTIDLVLRRREVELRELLRRSGSSTSYWVGARKVPLRILEQLHGKLPLLGPEDRVAYWGSGSWVPAVIPVDEDMAWLLGLYVAEGYRRTKQVIIAHRDQRILDRAESTLRKLGQTVHRGRAGITCCSVLLSAGFAGLGMGGRAPSKRLPAHALGWPKPLIECLLEGLIDGHGSVRPEGECLWTTSIGLVADALQLSARLGRRAVTACGRPRPRCKPLHVVSIARTRDKILTSVPPPRDLLGTVRSSGLSLGQESRVCGYRHASTLHTLEKRHHPDGVSVVPVGRLKGVSARLRADGVGRGDTLARLVEGDLLWDEVREVVDTGRFEPVYDLEVRPAGARIENFLAGQGGVFASNTAGYIDPAFEGHVTLEISNLANLPIALYPGMRIGQISFQQMTTPADRPYGPARGSKYSGQRLPTASRLYLDFRAGSSERTRESRE